MQQFTVSKAESGQQLIKYLKHLMPKAQNGFLYKMLRKKNITLNGKKSDGSATILQDDVIRLFLSDDTIHMLMAGNAADKPHEKVNGTEDKAAGEDRITKIGGTDKSRRKNDGNENGNENYDPDKIKASMIYEDEDLIIFNKPAGMLSQKAKAEDISANEVLIGYIKRNGYSELSFKPSV
ncbi:MAG: hypothetical protein J5842_06710, partial [Lachnospiraceae bacterium]|nr:hypothetical protein [Lachnospiraceae bacterium]